MDTDKSPEPTEFTPNQQRTLRRLRRRYTRERDLFAGDELARLRFLRWLRKSGRLAA